MTNEDIEATKAPLLDHLMELRTRLIRALIALGAATVICFAFADRIFNLLVVPYVRAYGPGTAKLIYTAPHEFLVTEMKLALFGGIFIASPIIVMELWRFVAPGLYRSEQKAVRPFLIATPVLFLAGAAMVYFLVMPTALQFLLGFQQKGGGWTAQIEYLGKVSEYLSFIMMLILAFGFTFQLPVLLALLGRAGLISSEQLRRGRRYAILIMAVVAAIITPPDILSMTLLLIPMWLLYEVSIWIVRAIERKRSPVAMAAKTAGE